MNILWWIRCIKLHDAGMLIFRLLRNGLTHSTLKLDCGKILHRQLSLLLGRVLGH